MNIGAVVISALLVALQVFFVMTFGPDPIFVACLVFTALMFVWTLVTAARS